MSVSPTAGIRCSVGARARGDALFATAPPARRFLLLEVPGAWGPQTLPLAGVDPGVARSVEAAATRAGVRPLLIRRPGRHPAAADGTRLWAVVTVGSGTRWGRWRRDEDLLAVDLGPDPVDGDAWSPDPGRPLALVCTQGRHDLCCAVEGRPVVAAAADPRIDVWECSHLGGDRFAANLLWLPDGYLFGGLSAATTAPVLQAALQGRVVLDHFRGRCGDPVVVQAGRWHLMRMLGEDRPDQVRIEAVRPAEGGERRNTVTAGHAGRRYRLELEWSWTEPQHLTCRAAGDARVRVHRPVGVPVLI